MKKKLFFVLILPLHVFNVWAQGGELPVKEWGSHAQNPFVLYISGDGGFNRFSLDLCNVLHSSGYSVTAVDAKSYFWHKKTPEQSALDIGMYLKKEFNGRQNQDLVLVGYSFGADVLPFIIQKLPSSLRIKIRSTILISPSATTDFEIHMTDIFGYAAKRNMDVPAEINKLTDEKIVTIFGDDESDFPVSRIRINKYTNLVLPGGHHFNGETDILAHTLIKYF